MMTFFFAVILAGRIAVAGPECPVLQGTFVCDGKLPGYGSVVAGSSLYEGGRKQEIAVENFWPSGTGSNREVYLPDEPAQTGRFPNGGGFRIADHCEAQVLTHESWSSGRLPNGSLRAVREMIRFSLDGDSLRVQRDSDEFLDGRKVRGHARFSFCSRQR